jgi:hypothetical protein
LFHFEKRSLFPAAALGLSHALWRILHTRSSKVEALFEYAR